MPDMRIVVAHNRYKYAGGEDAVMAAEVEMLRCAGHEVELLGADNRTIDGMVAKIAAAGSLFHSPGSSRRMGELIQTFRPDIVHIHNWFPLLSPSIISVACAAGVPVVQTLHNFRMFCANSSLYRDGRVCLDCAGKALPMGGVVHRCYSGSRVGSALVTAAFSYHRLAGTWDGISTFIAVSDFQRELLIRGGMNSAQIVVKPNFVRDPGEPGQGNGGYALFVGRVTAQKGIRTVLQAWEEYRPAMPLKIMGDGPLANEVRDRVSRLACVEYLGQRTASEVSSAMGAARFLIFASESYEPLGLTIVEAFSRGTPVLAARLESMNDLVKDGLTGLQFNVGDAADLAAKADQLFADTQGYCDLRCNCRRVYEERYTESQNYRMLSAIYAQAIGSKPSHDAERLERLLALSGMNSLGGEGL
jgi:glycosyltransferase involved in cell wall biosynthesis